MGEHINKVRDSLLRTKNLEHNLLVLQVLLSYFENNRRTEIRRSVLLEICESAYGEKYHGISDLGHSTFNRVLNDFEEELIVKLKKVGTKHTLIIFDVQRVKKILNDMKSQLGFYGPEKKITVDEIEPDLRKSLFQKIATSMLDNYQRPWISNIDEGSQYSYLIAEKCASKLTAILMASLFSFGSSLQSIDKNDLTELVIVASKIASKNLGTPFKLLIDYSGLPGTDDWGLMWKPDLRQTISVHFEEFAERYSKFKLSQSDLVNLKKGSLDNLSPGTRRLFDIFHKNYVLPTIRAMNSKNIKFE